MSQPRDHHVLRDRHRARGRRRAASDGPAAADAREGLTGLAPLRWRAEEDLVFDAATETLHRPGCGRLATGASVQTLAAGGVLERVMAPRVCEHCRPDVTLALGER